MRLRGKRGGLLVEVPSAACGDIAFNLIVFFLVCASTQPDTGRRQEIPQGQQQPQQQAPQNLEVSLSREKQAINGMAVSDLQFIPEIKMKLRGRTDPSDRIVVVRSGTDVPFSQWVKVTGWIAQAGGVVTMQLEEEQTIVRE